MAEKKLFDLGEYILEELEARGWTVQHLSSILNCPEKSINALISRERCMSPEMATALAKVFDVPVEFFINLQKKVAD